MKRASVVPFTILVLLIARGPAHASVELDVKVNLRFSETCEQTSGYWGAWDASTQPDRDALFEEYPPEAITWSSSQPITATYVGGPSQLDAAFWLVLFAPDRTTVLLETQFDLVDTGLTPYWSVDTMVDCASVPYRELAQPDTAVPRTAADWRTVGGVALVLFGLGGTVVRRTLVRRL